MTTLVVVEDDESWRSCSGRSSARSIYSHATILLTSLWGKAGHSGKVAMGADDMNGNGWMAAGDGHELIGATTLGVLNGVVCEDTMVKWGVRIGVAEKVGRLRADTRGGGGGSSGDGT